MAPLRTNQGALPNPRVGLAGLLLMLLHSSSSWAAPTAGPPEVEEASQEAPGARTGFQMAIETGVSWPFGEATGRAGDDLERRYSYQIPFNIELGAKVTKALYVGTYMGLAFGAEGDDPTIESYCIDDDDDGENDISCTSIGLSLGLEARYGFAPSANWNPWLSYGLGFEAVDQSIRDRERGYAEGTLASGVTYARLGAGTDFRRAVGVGPALHFAIGRFETERTEVGGDLVYQGSIDDPAWHMWLTLGLRMVIRP